MDVIAKITCEDCGNFIVSATNRASVFTMDLKDEGMVAMLATTCQFCDRPIIEDISIEKAEQLVDKGVSAFSWHDGKKQEKVNF